MNPVEYACQLPNEYSIHGFDNDKTEWLPAKAIFALDEEATEYDPSLKYSLLYIVQRAKVGCFFVFFYNVFFFYDVFYPCACTYTAC